MATLPDVSKITDKIYLCGSKDVTLENILKNDIKLIINCTNEVPSCNYVNNYIRIHLDDSPKTDIKRYFDRCINDINNFNDGNVLIHCHAGVSRSATICIAYMMKTNNLSLENAFRYVRSRRSIILPNYGFFQQLIDYEKELNNGLTTARLIEIGGMQIPDVVLKVVFGQYSDI